MVGLEIMNKFTKPFMKKLTAYAFSLIALMVSIQNITPIESDPASPIKTLAGEKLKKINPNIVPDKTPARRAIGIFPVK